MLFIFAELARVIIACCSVLGEVFGETKIGCCLAEISWWYLWLCTKNRLRTD